MRQIETTIFGKKQKKNKMHTTKFLVSYKKKKSIISYDEYKIITLIQMVSLIQI